jgi:hypothetical protein
MWNDFCTELVAMFMLYLDATSLNFPQIYLCSKYVILIFFLVLHLNTYSSFLNFWGELVGLLSLFRARVDVAKG